MCKMANVRQLSIIAIICISLFAILSDASCIALGVSGQPYMFYDYQRDVIILYGSNIYQIHSLDYHTNISTVIAGSYGITGYQDGNITTATIGMLGGLAPYYDGERIVGYLISVWQHSCIRYISADYPYDINTVVGNCSQSGSVRGTGANARMIAPYGITIGMNGTQRIYAVTDYSDQTILALTGNSSIMTISCIVCSQGLLFSRTLIYVSNLLFNDTYLKSDNLQQADILLVQMNYEDLRYYYNGTFKDIGLLHGTQATKQLITLKSFGDTIYAVKYQEDNTSVYYGRNITNMTQTTCAGYSNTMYDVVVLPSGIMIESYLTGYPLCQLDCTFPPYNVTQLSHTHTINDTHSRSSIRSVSPTISNIDTGTSSFSHIKTHTTASNGRSFSSFSDSKSSTTSETAITSKTHDSSVSVSYTVNGLHSPSISISGSVSLTNDGTISDSESTLSHTMESSETPTIKENIHTNTTDRTYTITQENVINTTPVVLISAVSPTVKESIKTATVAIGAIVAVSSGAGSVRTGAFMAITSGECGSVREFAWYENPLQIKLVFIGDAIFMIVILGIVLAFGKLRERHLGIDSTWREIIVKYKTIDIFFVMWAFFLPPMLASFVKYHTGSLEIASILLGGMYILFSLMLLAIGITDVFVAIRRDDASLTQERVIWMGNELIVPIITGYSSKQGLSIDMMATLIIAGSTVIDNCTYLAYITLSVNAIYCIIVIKWKIIQPQCIAYSNLSFAIGQSIGIVIVLLDSYGTIGVIIVYLSSLVGLIFMLLPVINFLYKHLCKKKEASTDVPLLILPIDWEEVQKEYDRSITSANTSGSNDTPLIEIL